MRTNKRPWEMTDAELAGASESMRQTSENRGSPFTPLEESQNATLTAEWWKREQVRIKQQIKGQREVDSKAGHAQYFKGVDWSSLEFAKKNQNPKITAYLATTDKPNFAGYVSFIS